MVSCFWVNDTEQKEDSDSEDAEENNEMSKNAQFRAIQPSPSLTLFVNENVSGLGYIYYD